MMTLRPRWHKVLADLWANKIRTLLVVLSIAVGVYAVGVTATLYAIVTHDMNASWMAIDPANAAFYTSYFDSDFVASLNHVPGVARFEGRTDVGGTRIRTGNGEWLELTLSASQDWGATQLDRLALVQGAWPGRREVVVDEVALRHLPVHPGDRVEVRTNDGKLRVLTVTGTVINRNADVNTKGVYAYITTDTLEWLGQPRYYNRGLMQVTDHPEDAAHVGAVSKLVEEQFARNGGLVGATIPRPFGQHPATSQVSSIIVLIGIMAVLSVMLSAFLVINTVSALLTQHIRYIGMMKAIGARTRQIVGMYMVLMLCFGLLAFALAAPLAILTGYHRAGSMAQTINFGLQPFRIDPLALGLMIFLSICVPLLAGLWPVMSGARRTVREAISGYGLSEQRTGPRLLTRIKLTFLPRPLTISLRNSVRRKGRLIMTLATLVLAGAIFIGVFSVRTALFATIEQVYRYFVADVNVDLDRSVRLTTLEPVLKAAPGVDQVEGWVFANGEMLQEGNVATDRLGIFAPPSDSTMVERGVTAGRWLTDEDENAIVISTQVQRSHPELKIGDTMRLKLNGDKKVNFVIVGVFPFPSGDGNKIGFVSYKYVADLTSQRGQAGSFRISTTAHDKASQDRAAEYITEQLKALGYKATVTTGYSYSESFGTILNQIIMFLVFMAALIALVGGLGLMGTMTMNVMERTREIGVMRSIGATNSAIMGLVLTEGLLVGLVSWVGGALLAMPIAQVLCSAMGTTLFGNPMTFNFAWDGLADWLIVVLVLSTLASLLPASNAARLTVREVLAYE
jgi:putative ABC transport system permease protein